MSQRAQHTSKVSANNPEQYWVFFFFFLKQEAETERFWL